MNFGQRNDNHGTFNFLLQYFSICSRNSNQYSIETQAYLYVMGLRRLVLIHLQRIIFDETCKAGYSSRWRTFNISGVGKGIVNLALPTLNVIIWIQCQFWNGRVPIIMLWREGHFEEQNLRLIRNFVCSLFLPHIRQHQGGRKTLLKLIFNSFQSSVFSQFLLVNQAVWYKHFFSTSRKSMFIFKPYLSIQFYQILSMHKNYSTIIDTYPIFISFAFVPLFSNQLFKATNNIKNIETYQREVQYLLRRHTAVIMYLLYLVNYWS